jgi:hypothetical protein
MVTGRYGRDAGVNDGMSGLATARLGRSPKMVRDWLPDWLPDWLTTAVG